MIILHIASIANNTLTGVNAAVPQHVLSQGQFADVGFMNVRNIAIDALNNLPPDRKLQYSYPFVLHNLPKPFNKPDLVVFHECYRIEYLQISNCLLRYKIPYVIIPHGELSKMAQRRKHLKKAIANLLLFNRFINRAIAIQCLSDNESWMTHFGKKKFVGTNGVMIPEIIKKEYRSDGIRMVFIGRLDKYVKGLDLLIDAVSRLKIDMLKEHAYIDIYGPDQNGWYTQVEQLIYEAGVSELINLHHEIIGQQKEEVLLDSDVFIQTSRHEGMPLSILEAMSYGIPCLVTEGTNLGDYIVSKSAGWKANNNAESISETILAAIRDKHNYPEYGHNGREAVCKDYSWDIVSHMTIKEYEALIM